MTLDDKQPHTHARAANDNPPTTATPSFVHSDVGACVPHRQMIAGALPLHILVQKHNFYTDKNAMSDV
jgi:hypothetical protein